MNKENKKRLQELYREDAHVKFPSMPRDYIAIPKYTDGSTNGLTRCVKDFLNFSGHQAERINTTGRILNTKQKFTDVVGFGREIGSMKYIPGTGTKGSADLSCTIRGRSVKIEIKFGKDTQSDDQKEYQESIEKAGGVYIIVRTFDEFIQWYDNFIFGELF